MLEIKFSQIPDLTISLISSSPALKAMAFGAVAIGSIKAQEAAMVAGTMSR